jgi:peptidoglycan-associated lipoprotein
MFAERMTMTTRIARLALVISIALAAACGSKKSPVVEPQAPPPADVAPPPQSVAPPTPRIINEATPTVPPVRDDALTSSSLDDLNRNSPLKPVFYLLDSSDIDPAAKAALDENAAVLKQHATWVVTVEGHCDERGTAEYNLALGDRRAAAAVAYLRSLGIAADRMKTVSYGKEFPFDAGHDEAAWSKNRRAHFVITGK